MKLKIKTSFFFLAIFIVMTCVGICESQTHIGSHYKSVLNGISFVQPERCGFMFRVGFVGQNGKYKNDKIWEKGALVTHGPSAPDYSINDIDWKTGNTTIRFVWSKNSDSSAVGIITCDKPIRIALEATPSWQTFPTTYSINGNEIRGRGQYAIAKRSMDYFNWRLIASGKPVAEVSVSDQQYQGELIVKGESKRHENSRHAALVYDLDPKTPLVFAAGLGGLPGLDEVSEIIRKAREEYDNKRSRAWGDWGMFLDPMMNQYGHNRVYDFLSGHIAPVVTRSWNEDDGAMFFVWDSFFNALMYSIENFEEAREQVRTVFAGQFENGLIPLASGARWWDTCWDRSQPPVGSFCVWKIYQRWPDKTFLEECYPKLKKWHDWWFAIRPSNGLPHRDGNKNGLLEWGSEVAGNWQNAVWESGLDDSPMYDEAEMIGNNLALDDVGLSSLWSMDAEYLVYIAKELGYQSDAERFAKEKADMNMRINKLLWNEELGMYCNRYWLVEERADYKMGEIITSQNLLTDDNKPGFKAKYYKGANFDELVLTRIESKVDYHCGPKVEGIGNSTYSVRWSGNIIPSKTGNYTFTAMSYEAVRLWVDGELIIDGWNLKGHNVVSSRPIRLEKDKPVSIMLEHHRGWRDQIKLSWYEGQTPPEKSIFSSSLSPMCFYPLISGAPNKQRAERMLKVLQNPEKFWGDWIIPTITRDDPAYPDEHYWRGKIWPPSNYLVYQGLKQYADEELRAEFARKSIKLFMRNWEKTGRCHENFTNNGNGSSMPYYTWGALMCLIGLEEICDIELDNKVRLNGALYEDIKLRGIPMFGQYYNIETKNDAATLLKDEKVVMNAKDRVVIEKLK